MARDGCYDIASTMKYTLTSTVNAGLKKKQNKKVTNTGFKETQKVENFSNTLTPVILQTTSLSSKYKSNADSEEDRKQSALVDVRTNFELESDMDKSFDSQKTI